MTILGTILNRESGGRNVTQGNIGDINNQTGDLAQGYFQITNGTWRDFGGNATPYSSAIAAPYAVQRDVALNVPVSRWGDNTRNDLAAAGYVPLQGETLGQMLARYGEDPAATVPADGSSPVGGGQMLAEFDPATGLPASTTDVAGSMTGSTSKLAAGTGSNTNVGLQPSLVKDITTWLNGITGGAFKGVGSVLASIQNLFVRAFVIILGIVLLTIALLKITGTDKVVIEFAKTAAHAAVAA